MKFKKAKNLIIAFAETEEDIKGTGFKIGDKMGSISLKTGKFIGATACSIKLYEEFERVKAIEKKDIIEQRAYTIEQIDKIIETNGWSITTCEKEKDGEDNRLFDTLQVAQEEDQDYFGEFVGRRDENKYAFRLYI